MHFRTHADLPHFSQGPPNPVSDITYVPTAEGWLHLATILDLFSPRVVRLEVKPFWKQSDPEIARNVIRELEKHVCIRAEMIKVTVKDGSVGRASRPSFLFHPLAGETPIPLFGNTPKFLRSPSVTLRASVRGVGTLQVPQKPGL